MKAMLDPCAHATLVLVRHDEENRHLTDVYKCMDCNLPPYTDLCYLELWGKDGQNTERIRSEQNG